VTLPVSESSSLVRAPAAASRTDGRIRAERLFEGIAIPTLALAVALLLFGGFVAVFGYDPVQTYALIWRGAFGTEFSWENTLARAAPLLLTSLATALPAWLGLVVIGGEGALVLGGLTAAVVGTVITGSAPLLVQLAMEASGMLVGALWLMLPGALRLWRGVNETISSLLLNYIAIAVLNQLVEGALRDPASLNKPSTRPLDPSIMIGMLPGLNVHYGLLFGLLFCLATGLLMTRTTFGFAARIAGGNLRAARMAGVNVARLVLVACALGGAAAGLAGVMEVAAVQGSATASLAAGYGYTGILVAFVARQNPFAIIPVSILLGGITASSGLLQRRLGMPDAAVIVLEGIVFIAVLAADTLTGRLRVFLVRQAAGG
jgi:simple sugar transport system permease protein